MIRTIPLNILRFVILVLLQVLLFNNIQFSGYVNPYIYVLFILLLPFETPKWFLLVLGFFMGLVIDIAMNTPGMHTSATVFIAFLRPYVLSYISPRDGYEVGSSPTVSCYGLTWFLRYAVTITFLHHSVLFYLEIFRLSSFFDTLLKVIISTVFSLIFILIAQYISFNKQK